MTTMTLLPDSRTPLDPETAFAAFGDMLDGKTRDEENFRFLSDMAERDETSTEIAAAARAMRERMIRITAPAGAIDVCGTGGDGAHSLNVSTAVAIVVAATGVPVAKHGNRAASSLAGGADTLEALGLDLDQASARAEESLADLGIAFLFAQKHHPALVKLAPVRKRIGRRTVFNLTGPVCNPAGVTRQLIGVARPDFLPVYAEAIAMLGTDSTMLVSGDEPLDELSIAGPSTIIRIGACGNGSGRVTPADARLTSHPLTAIKGGDARHNAAALRRLLQGEQGAYRDAVLLNAAAALIVAGEASTLADGVEETAETIDKGLAKALLDCWIAF
jgi:anthranilate phosphoribosyltransferase